MCRVSFLLVLPFSVLVLNTVVVWVVVRWSTAYRKWLEPFIGVPVAVTDLLARCYQPDFTWAELVNSPAMAGKPLPGIAPATRREMACHIWHPGLTCGQRLVQHSRATYKAALAVYIPFQAARLLLFRRKQLCEQPVDALRSAAVATLRSSLFLTTYACSVWATHCFTHSVLRLHAPWLFFLCGALGGSSIFIEPSSRRPELALYTFGHAVRSFCNRMVERGLLRRSS